MDYLVKKYHSRKTQGRGFSLIEVLIVSSLMTLIFIGLLLGYKYSLDMILISRARLTALSLATERMEYIRSLSYNSVGTQLGIPSGHIPQTRHFTYNGIDFEEKVLIEYVDDPADGLGPLDNNGITTDYKRAKVTYSWELAGNPHSIFLVTNIVPRSIESNVGGGTVRILVFDENTNPLPGASVRLFNLSGTNPVDVTRTTNVNGEALFGGAPASAGYEVEVTRFGYSSDGTYKADTLVASPANPPLTVEDANIATARYNIDRLASLDIQAYTALSEGIVVEDFTDDSILQASNNMEVVGGSLRLSESGAGNYMSSGTAFLPIAAPSPLQAWHSLELEIGHHAGTALRYRLYSSTSTADVIPNGLIIGNESGLTNDFVSLANLDAVTFPQLYLGVEAETANPSHTPNLDSVTVNYYESTTAASLANLSVASRKLVGHTVAGVSVPKNRFNITTNTSGSYYLADLEYDTYDVNAPGRSVASACLSNAAVVQAGSAQNLSLLLRPAVSNSLRVVVNNSGSRARGASVQVSGPGYNQTLSTDFCGQAFFTGFTSTSTHIVEINHKGAHGTFTDVPIEGVQVWETSL